MALKTGMTVSELIKSVKSRMMLPEANSTFSDDDLLAFANEEMLIGLVPSILQMKDDYLTAKAVTPLNSPQVKYPLPERSLGNKLRDVAYSSDGINEYEMTQINSDEKYSGIGMTSNTGYMRQFYMQGDSIVLYPDTNSTIAGFLYFYYYMRPNTLVKDAAVAAISNINRTTGEITVSNLPTTYTISSTFDFVKRNSPHSIMTKPDNTPSIDLVVTNIQNSAKIITLSNAKDIPFNLQVGDYIALAGETCIPNVPTELHSVLAQRVACRVLEAIGDTAGLTNANNKLQEMEGKTGILLDSRVEGAVHKVRNRGTTRTIRGRSFGRGFF
jgi:hypothetical protein